ncbi:glycosyltransferase family 2 protein [Urechidicola sp. KH5]
MKLSIVIVNYNARYFLELCLQSVLDAVSNLDAEIIVVDNNSTDDSCAMVERKFPEALLISNKENFGFSKANNQGVAKARGQYVLILNPDTVVAQDTFEKIIDFAKSRHNFGALGARLIGGHGSFLSESKRSIPTPMVSFNKLMGITSRETSKYYANHLKEDETGVIEILVGAFMFMTRKVYNEVKGFDESYFMYGEDIDLSYKILNKGYQNYYYADSEVIHFKGECTVRDAKRLHHFHEAMKIFYREHFKVNRLYDFVMYLGINFWYVMKALGKGKKTKRSKLPEKIAYCGSDDSVYNRLERICNGTTKLYHFSEVGSVQLLKDFAKSNNVTEFVFDSNSYSYTRIIELMSALKNEGLTFKIHPRNTNYILGSNTSDSRGDVFVFES